MGILNSASTMVVSSAAPLPPCNWAMIFEQDMWEPSLLCPIGNFHHFKDDASIFFPMENV